MKTRTNVRRGTNIVLDCRIPVERAQAILSDISDTGCRIELKGIAREMKAQAKDRRLVLLENLKEQFITLGNC